MSIERIESGAGAGDLRKTWKRYKEVLFNQTSPKTDSSITINGVSVNDTEAPCNGVNDHFCTAGENLAKSIIAVHGYSEYDINNLYPEHSNNDWSFQNVDSGHVIKSMKSLNSNYCHIVS